MRITIIRSKQSFQPSSIAPNTSANNVYDSANTVTAWTSFFGIDTRDQYEVIRDYKYLLPKATDNLAMRRININVKCKASNITFVDGTSTADKGQYWVVITTTASADNQVGAQMQFLTTWKD